MLFSLSWATIIQYFYVVKLLWENPCYFLLEISFFKAPAFTISLAQCCVFIFSTSHGFFCSFFLVWMCEIEPWLLQSLFMPEASWSAAKSNSLTCQIALLGCAWKSTNKLYSALLKASLPLTLVLRRRLSQGAPFVHLLTWQGFNTTLKRNSCFSSPTGKSRRALFYVWTSLCSLTHWAILGKYWEWGSVILLKMLEQFRWKGLPKKSCNYPFSHWSQSRIPSEVSMASVGQLHESSKTVTLIPICTTCDTTAPLPQSPAHIRMRLHTSSLRLAPTTEATPFELVFTVLNAISSANSSESLRHCRQP